MRKCDTNQATKRFFSELELLRASIKRSGISKTQAVAERIGRIKSKYSGVWPNYEIGLVYHENHGKIINKRRFDKVIDLLSMATNKYPYMATKWDSARSSF